MTESALDLEALSALVEKASPGPWFYDSYSTVFSSPKVQATEDFWTDERLGDGHTYDHRAGQICPACGERPAIHGDNALPEFRGKRFGTYWDCARSEEAMDAESAVAHVNASYGDTATGQRIADAQFIAAARNVIPELIAEIIRLRGQSPLVDDIRKYITTLDYEIQVVEGHPPRDVSDNPKTRAQIRRNVANDLREILDQRGEKTG